MRVFFAANYRSLVITSVPHSRSYYEDTLDHMNVIQVIKVIYRLPYLPVFWRRVQDLVMYGYREKKPVLPFEKLELDSLTYLVEMMLKVKLGLHCMNLRQ